MVKDNPDNKEPTEQDAISILKKGLNEEVASITRFSTGSEHYVYDVVTQSNKKLVVRISRKNSKQIIAGAIYWHNILKPKGVPLPRLLFAEIDDKVFNFPVMIMERLSGQDLGYVYPQLTFVQKRKLAGDINNIQNIVAALPMASGFGYAASYKDDTLKPTWLALLENQLERTKRRISEAKIINMNYYEEVNRLIHKNNAYFSSIKPVGFLDDTTTKNVIIDNGKLTGIVDTDYVCFGDRLFVVSLLQMALLSKQFDIEYVSCWCDFLKITPEQEKMLTLYTLMHCVGFMSEFGQRFNRSKPGDWTEQGIQNLTSIFDNLLEQYHKQSS